MLVLPVVVAALVPVEVPVLVAGLLEDELHAPSNAGRPDSARAPAPPLSMARRLTFPNSPWLSGTGVDELGMDSPQGGRTLRVTDGETTRISASLNMFKRDPSQQPTAKSSITQLSTPGLSQLRHDGAARIGGRDVRVLSPRA